MNLLLLQPSQINGNEATVIGRQLEHLRTVHQLDQGSSVRVGEVNGLMGNGIIKSIDARACGFGYLSRYPCSLGITPNADYGDA